MSTRHIIGQEILRKISFFMLIFSLYTKDPQPVALGSLGSHWLEHFFGQVRQASRGNDTYECFERNVYNTILANSLEQEIGIKLISSKRSSLSGSILGQVDVKEVISSDLSFSLHIAAKLHLILLPDLFSERLNSSCFAV